MTATITDFSQFTGKKVTVIQLLDEPNAEGNTADELEGKVEVGNEHGVLFKPKGKAGTVLIEGRQIESIVELVEPEKALKPKVLRPITEGNARAHLADRHGIALTWLNSNSEKDALAFHNTLDHEKEGLGHVHKAEAETPVEETARVEAIASAE